MRPRKARHVVAFVLAFALAFLIAAAPAWGQAVPTDDVGPLSGLVVVVRNESPVPARAWLVREDAEPVVLIVIPPKTARAFHVTRPAIRAGGEFTGCAWELSPRRALVADPVRVSDGEVMTCLLPAGATNPSPSPTSQPPRSTEDA